jgi:hypothetical protein
MKNSKTRYTEYVTTFMRKTSQPVSCRECKTPIKEGEEYVQEVDRFAVWLGCIVASYCHDCGKKYDKSNRVMLPSEQG